MLRFNVATGEIYIYDAIGPDWFGDGITALAVQDALDQIGPKKAIVRINSPGGVADEGIAIYNALKRHKAGCETHNDALAASAASVVFLAGKERYASAGSKVMIHRALTIDMGNASQFRKTAETLEKYDASLAEIYAEHMGIDSASVLQLLDEETWYTPDEAIEAKLATAKSPEMEVVPKVANWFKRAPESLLNKKPAASCDALRIQSKMFGEMLARDPKAKMPAIKK